MKLNRNLDKSDFDSTMEGIIIQASTPIKDVNIVDRSPIFSYEALHGIMVNAKILLTKFMSTDRLHNAAKSNEKFVKNAIELCELLNRFLEENKKRDEFSVDDQDLLDVASHDLTIKIHKDRKLPMVL